MIMNIHVKKWGNSASVRIPAAMMAAARLRIDDPVRVREQDGAIIIEPLLNPATELEAMLDTITPEMLHGEFDSGEAVGREAW
jgi:antitoxin MazE